MLSCVETQAVYYDLKITLEIRHGDTYKYPLPVNEERTKRRNQ